MIKNNEDLDKTHTYEYLYSLLFNFQMYRIV